MYMYYVFLLSPSNGDMTKTMFRQSMFYFGADGNTFDDAYQSCSGHQDGYGE
jgi:hypothetical protein